MIIRSLKKDEKCPKTGIGMISTECWLCTSCDSAYYKDNDKEQLMVKCSFEKG
jgi:hypothetical protein